MEGWSQTRTLKIPDARQSNIARDASRHFSGLFYLCPSLPAAAGKVPDCKCRAALKLCLSTPAQATPERYRRVGRMSRGHAGARPTGRKQRRPQP